MIDVLVFRMGSFTAAAQVAGGDSQDDHLEFPSTSLDQLLARCRKELHKLPAPFHRQVHTDLIDDYKLRGLSLKIEVG